ADRRVDRVAEGAGKGVVTRPHDVVRACGTGARASFRDVASVHCRTAHRVLIFEGIGGTVGIRPVAALGHVAGTRRGPALRTGVARRVLAGSAGAVAGVGRARITVVGARRPARLRCICGTGGVRPVAGLGHVAVARGGPALGAGVARRVLAGSAGAVAGVGRARIAVVGARRPARLRCICGTGGIRPVADLGHVAVGRGGPALGAGVPRRAALALSAAAGVVGRARIGVVTWSGVVGVHAAQGHVAGVVGAGVAVVAVGRGAPNAAVVHVARLEPVADVPVVTVRVGRAAAGDRSVDAADGGIAGVVGADQVVVAVEQRPRLAARHRVAGLQTVTGVSVVAHERRAALAGARNAGLRAGADVAVVAVGVRSAATRDRCIHAAARVVVGCRVAAVGGAHHPVIAGRGRAGHARPILRVAGLEAVAEEAVVAGDGGRVGADVLGGVAGVGRAEGLVVAIGVDVAAGGDRRAAAQAGRVGAAVRRADVAAAAEQPGPGLDTPIP